MKEGPIIASVAALIGDPARANMLTALMDGRALTASELAEAAGITLQTSSGHLAKLSEAKLITADKQGRHRYFRLSDTDVAEVLEALMGLAQRTGAVRVRTGPRDAALREARICYDHLAGESGVSLLHALERNALVHAGETPTLTEKGRDFFAGFGIDIPTLEKSRRPVCRHCLDWSERRYHLGGALGATLLAEFVRRAWMKRKEGRVLVITPVGRQQLRKEFNLDS
jgi:DNA-binding transcriptional ArsR family regulator